jgi:hypothetical protein
VIAGVVLGANAQVPANLTVSVMGTSLSTAAGSDGGFQISGVPAGDVQLQFRNQDVNAIARLASVTSNQFVDIRVQVSNTSAVITNEERTDKVSLCHTEGNGTYHLIDVSVSAEATHRAHGDGKIGDPVPGQPLKTFDANCRPVGPSVEIKKSTNGEDADAPPGPSIALGSIVTWRYVVTNTGTVPLTSVLVVDDHASVTVSCGGQTTLAPAASMTCTATGVVTQLGQYRNVGTVTANWATPTANGTLTDTDPSHYLGISPVEIKKFTNGEDADNPPGPSITVGTPVLWEYRVSNVGTVPLTSILVVDDHPLTVSCPATTLAPGASMTCTANGTAVLGQYSNRGTVTASWSQPPVSGTATDFDLSHYVGRVAGDDGQKVDLCHRTGNGSFHLINVSISAEPAHLAHGDGRPGGAVPGSPGRTFGANCSVQ